MSACSQCGTVPKPNDKFCNTCGTPIAQAAPPAYGGAAPGAQSSYGGGGYGGAPPPGYGAPPRCQMGHDIAPGQSYCAQGHPIALDAMQFAQDQYGQQQGYGQPPYAAPQQYAPPGGGYAPQAPGYGAMPGGYPAPPGQGPQAQGGFPAPQPPPNMYGPAPGFGGQPPGFDPSGGAPPPPAGAASIPQQQMVLPPNALRGFLVTYQTNTKGEFWPLFGGRVTVGRSSSGDQVDIPLPDATISSRHAMIVVDGAQGTIAIEDTGSTNGTYVNEEHLGFNGRRELRDGDRVRFGGYTTIVKLIGRF